ncbi:hypothetical protein [Prauserella flavalba]|uniref:Uncharacterized protein n=1 Tax=Prauserella flavalba TaxID=1477506 RepID=A0A318LV93_9PSEU|nr:hypothetical protein [Prauserella flavalba]PXY37415.1 hypothetical protein BA062_06740 [Prauserella flavalba]
MLAGLAELPVQDGVYVETMRARARKVCEAWPLGDRERAVGFLLHEAYPFTATGLPARTRDELPSPYCPAAGGLLYAVAMLAAGWDGAPEGDAPRFPDDGSWEGLSPAL